MTHILPIVAIDLVAEYAISIGFCYKELGLRRDLIDLAENEVKLAIRRLTSPVDRLINNDLSLIGKLDLAISRSTSPVDRSIENSSRILVKSILPCDPKKLNEVVKLLKHRPHIWDIDSAKNCIREVLTIHKDFNSTEFEEIQSIFRLFHWTADKVRKLSERNKDLEFHSSADRVIHNLKIINLERIHVQLRKKADELKESPRFQSIKNIIACLTNKKSSSQIQETQVYIEKKQTIIDKNELEKNKLKLALEGYLRDRENDPREYYFFRMGFSKTIKLRAAHKAWQYVNNPEKAESLTAQEYTALFDKNLYSRIRPYDNLLLDKITGCGLYLTSKFDIEQCKGMKGNAVILTDKNTAYFIIEDKIVMKDEKPQVVENINRQGIEFMKFSDSMKPIEYTVSEQKKEKVIKESTLKGGHTQIKIEDNNNFYHMVL